MLEMKCVGDEMCWRRNVLVTKCVDDYSDLSDPFGHFGHQHPWFYTLAPGTNIQNKSSTAKFCHQHPIIVSNFKSLLSLRFRKFPRITFFVICRILHVSIHSYRFSFLILGGREWSVLLTTKDFYL